MQHFLYFFTLLLLTEGTSSSIFLLNFNNSTNVENIIKQKCERNGGENVFDKLKEVSITLLEVIKENFEYSSIKNETSETCRKQLLNKAFQEYCKNNQIYNKHKNKLLAATKSCLSTEEIPVLHLANNVINKTTEFICYKNGDRIAMFITEGGFECLINKSEHLQLCLSDVLAIEPKVSLTNNDYFKTHKCVVKVLDECEDVTAANMIDALMKKFYNLEIKR